MPDEMFNYPMIFGDMFKNIHRNNCVIFIYYTLQGIKASCSVRGDFLDVYKTMAFCPKINEICLQSINLQEINTKASPCQPQCVTANTRPVIQYPPLRYGVELFGIRVN